MKKRQLLALAAGVSIISAGPAPAGVKPCRDKLGRVVECLKTRKPSPRCKDSHGRFVACPAPPDGNTAERQRAETTAVGRR